MRMLQIHRYDLVLLNDAKKMTLKQTAEPTLNATIMPLDGIIRDVTFL
jgi:hypothetical protein